MPNPNQASLQVISLPKEGAVLSNTGGAITQAGKTLIPEGGYIKIEKGVPNVYNAQNSKTGTLTTEELSSVQGNLKSTEAYKSSFTGVSGVGGHLIDGVIWAAGAFGFGYMIAGAFGLKGKNSLAVGSSLASGVFTYKIFQALGPSGAGKISETCATWCGVGVGAD